MDCFKEEISSSGKPYYRNKITNETQWGFKTYHKTKKALPKGWVRLNLDGKPFYKYISNKNEELVNSSYAYSPNQSAATLQYATETTVPSSSIRSAREIADLRDVFRHQITGLRYNEKEPDILMPPDREPAQVTNRKEVIERNGYDTPTPEWKKWKDEDGDDYFQNMLTGVVQWKPPNTLVLIKDEPVSQRRPSKFDNYEDYEDYGIYEIISQLGQCFMSHVHRERIVGLLLQSLDRINSHRERKKETIFSENDEVQMRSVASETSTLPELIPEELECIKPEFRQAWIDYCNGRL